MENPNYCENLTAIIFIWATASIRNFWSLPEFSDNFELQFGLPEKYLELSAWFISGCELK